MRASARESWLCLEVVEVADDGGGSSRAPTRSARELVSVGKKILRAQRMTNFRRGQYGDH